MSGRFEGKAAIVTGGASGIGAATVARLASEGAGVMVADIRPPATLHPGVVFHPVDLTSSEQTTAMVEAAASQFQRLDVLVNNAGIGHLAETPELTDADWDRVFAINVSAVLYACRAAIAHLRLTGGAIVNVASVSGLVGDYGLAAYNASKAAVINYTRTLALDCGRDGVRVNALCPGAIGGTAMGVGSYGSPEDKRSWIEAIPIGRLGRAEEMANVIAFLASAEASYMTGAIVTADGGVTAHTGLPNVPAQQRRRVQDKP